ncbi:MAG: endonuclease/exonuclease/phosphatase family protein [Candidatus Solibacter sp.]|nr:endonuclease/exonuclease/phosphatase family protein [Candidatus Solibacter sp.]
MAAHEQEDYMLFSLKSTAGRRCAGTMFLVAACALFWPQTALADNPHVVTVMTRNMDAGTDLNYILAATDQASLLAGIGATLAEVKASGIPARASRLADEIATHKPDLIALQEVALWRTGPLFQSPATEVLYDQLDLLMAELTKRKLHYGIVAVQSLFDAEVPVPADGIDLRMTDRNVILARIDLPQSQFDITNVQTHRYKTIFTFGSPLLGEFVEPMGWMSLDVEVFKSKFRFVNTHLESTSVPQGDKIQMAQVDELLAALSSPGMPVILAGDFNSNAEPGPENTGAVRKIELQIWAIRDTRGRCSGRTRQAGQPPPMSESTSSSPVATFTSGSAGISTCSRRSGLA